jgi:hypothetical protein
LMTTLPFAIVDHHVQTRLILGHDEGQSCMVPA